MDNFLCGWYDLVCGHCNCFNLITSFLIKTLADYIISIEASQRGSASGWQKVLQECRESMYNVIMPKVLWFDAQLAPGGYRAGTICAILVGKLLKFKQLWNFV